jgi:hypothetical protein
MLDYRQGLGLSNQSHRCCAAFSSQAVLSVAASLIGLRISPTFPVPSGHPDLLDTDIDEETGQRLPYAWIMTYPYPHPYPHPYPNATSHMPPQSQPQSKPQSKPQSRRPPEVLLRSLHANQRLMEHEVACLLGYWHHEHVRLADPDAPGGTILLPRDPGITTLLHQYAIALLGLPRDCPQNWTCHCNAIRARFNAPPPDHEAPTGAFSVDDLAHDDGDEGRDGNDGEDGNE